MRGFASDNWSGVHPQVLDAIARANDGHAPGYGADEWTARAVAKVRAALGRPDAQVHFVFNGTGANVLGLSAIARPYDAVLCAEGAHVAADECGAPERFAGVKLVPIPTPHGKLTPDLLKPHVKGVGNEHHTQPRIVSITQSTELGTVYRPDELRALRRFCDERGMLLHMDGARLANAAATLDGDARAATEGVDVLSFGGTKNGALAAEAVVILRPGLAEDFRFIRKQGMQLASKMRFVAAQFDALLTDDLWLRSARHANAMARMLADEAAKVPGVSIAHPVEANAVFAHVPQHAIDKCIAEVPFYRWDEHSDLVRWVCSFDTTEDDVRRLVAALRKHV